jgi:hypothetical protein
MGGQKDKHTRRRQVISFPPLTRGRSSSSLMVIRASIEGQLVHRVYLDGGSASEIIYENYFNQLKAETKKKLRRSDVPLIGFSGETVTPMGAVELEVTLGEGRGARTEKLLFLVVQSSCSYNVLIGRLGISAFEAVGSTTHGMMRFPATKGITTIEADRREGQVCSIEEGPHSRMSINSKYPEQPIHVGTILSPRGMHLLEEILRKNKDVFAWCHTDMT